MSQLMAKERVASETEQKSVEQEEEATLELSSAENLKSGFKKGSNTKSSALDIVGKQHTSVSDLKKEVSTLGKRAATAKVTRNALQRQLDTELNKLSSEQIHAHDIKKPKSTVREGFTETVKAAMSKAKVPALPKGRRVPGLAGRAGRFVRGTAGEGGLRAVSTPGACQLLTSESRGTRARAHPGIRSPKP